MARPTTAEEITRLETELAALRVKISEQEAVGEMEEGGAGARFRTKFTPILELYSREQKLQTQLETLYSYSAVTL